MRYVRRRVTREDIPPWITHELRHVGAPRVCLSNVARPIEISGPNGAVTVGYYDAVTRLYQHYGATSRSAVRQVGDVWHVLYHPAEWDRICRDHECRWIEYADEDRMAVARLSVRAAKANVQHDVGGLSAIPFHLYEQETRPR